MAAAHTRRAARLGLLAGLLLWAAAPLAAQPTNQAQLAALAEACLAPLPDTLAAFRLEGLPPYLRTALVPRWQAEGRTLYAGEPSADSLATPALPVLRVTVETAAVAYTRAGRRRLGRSVRLVLLATLLAPDGRLLREARCERTAEDVVPRSAHAALEDPAIPATQAPLPPGSWRRRYLEPAVLTAATALVVFLFFSLRNDAPAADAP